MSGFRLTLAGLDEQGEIIRHIESAFGWIDRLASDAVSARKLIENLDQAMLAKAFQGELVRQDPADEPASVLLKRIKAERPDAVLEKAGGHLSDDLGGWRRRLLVSVPASGLRFNRS